MPLPLQTETMEHDKFRMNSNNEPAVQVIAEGSVINANSLIPEEYDDIKLFYTNDDLTKVEYYKDSSLVATLDLSYSNGKLVEVSRS